MKSYIRIKQLKQRSKNCFYKEENNWRCIWMYIKISVKVMHLIDKNVGVLCEALGWNQFLQQDTCSHVDESRMLSSHLLKSHLKYKYNNMQLLLRDCQISWHLIQVTETGQWRVMHFFLLISAVPYFWLVLNKIPVTWVQIYC